MKAKNIRKKIFAAVLAAAVAVSATLMTGFAEKIPVKIPTPGNATVSDELDSTDAAAGDVSIGTQFYMYIPPDPDTTVKDYPQMGDEGTGTQVFLIGAIVSGLVYLGLSGYANSGDKRQVHNAQPA